MNVLERAECLLDAGSSGNMNFTVVARYRGPLEESTLRQALAALQSEHLLLRSSLLWEGESCRFTPTSAPVPVHREPWPGDRDPQRASQAWKPAAMAALRQRFCGDGEPLWRITWLKGGQGGEVLLTGRSWTSSPLQSCEALCRGCSDAADTPEAGQGATCSGGLPGA